MTHLDNAASCNFVRLTQIHHQACRVSFTQTWPPDAFQLSTLSLSSSLYHSCRGGCSWEPIKHWRLTLWTVSWPAISPSFRLRLELVKTCPPSGFFPGHSRSSVLSWRMSTRVARLREWQPTLCDIWLGIHERRGWDFLPFSPVSTRPH